MWLKRRKAELGAPEAVRTPGVAWMVVILLVGLGVMFPALGVTALVMLAIEYFVLRRVPPVRDWLGLAH